MGIQITRAILKNKRHGTGFGTKSPILCICFTNHALDQFLEGLLDSGVDGIIRMGGRKTSERLQECSLRFSDHGKGRVCPNTENL